MTNIIVNGKDAETIKTETFEHMRSLENTFGIVIKDDIVINLHGSRASYNKKIGKESQSWEVGNTSKDNTIDIIHPSSFEKYSSHKKGEFPSILKHEMAHIYIRHISQNKSVPSWLDEGLAMCVSGQVAKYQNDEPLFAEEDFLRKISTQFGWDQHANYDGYRYACLFVDYLIKKYSTTQVTELVKDSKRVFEIESFEIQFKEKFNITLREVEKAFINEYNTDGGIKV